MQTQDQGQQHAQHVQGDDGGYQAAHQPLAQCQEWGEAAANCRPEPPSGQDQTGPDQKQRRPAKTGMRIGVSLRPIHARWTVACSPAARRSSGGASEGSSWHRW